MYDHVAIVKQNPATFFVSLDTQPPVAHSIFQGVVDFFAHRVQLTTTCAAGNHEVIEDGGEFAHIEHDDVGAAVVFSSVSGQQAR